MDAEERNTKAAEEMESDIEDREEEHRDRETSLQKEANQDIQTGTNDADHPGIRWGSSYKTKRKASTRNRLKKSTGDSESKR